MRSQFNSILTDYEGNCLHFILVCYAFRDLAQNVVVLLFSLYYYIGGVKNFNSWVLSLVHRCSGIYHLMISCKLLRSSWRSSGMFFVCWKTAR